MRKRAQRGFAMLLVMMLVAMAVVLGMSYLSVASLHSEMGRNFRQAARARYLAESGLQHALYIYRFDPDQIDAAVAHPLGPYYLDDDKNAEYTISAQLVGTNKYTLLATAVVGGVRQGNQIIGGFRRTSSLAVSRKTAPRAERKHGMFVSGGGMGVTLAQNSDTTINGDVHINADLNNYATIKGDVSTTGNVSDPRHRINGTISEHVKSITPPTITVDQYVKYPLNGRKYDALVFTQTSLSTGDGLGDGKAITPTNPAGVVYLKPKKGTSVQLKGNLNFQGTLIIDGDVEIDGSNITLTAVDGFPAIVATGAVKMNNQSKNLLVNGLVAADSGITGGTAGGNKSSSTINGAVYSQAGGYSSTLRGTHTLNYQSDLAQVYDFSLPTSQLVPQVTVTCWND